MEFKRRVLHLLTAWGASSLIIALVYTGSKADGVLEGPAIGTMILGTIFSLATEVRACRACPDPPGIALTITCQCLRRCVWTLRRRPDARLALLSV